VLTARPALEPGSCVGNFDWSVTLAASGQSTLAGVLAGFVFGGIVVVLSVRVASRGEEAANALKLLFCAFFGLAVVAYLYTDETGDKICLRASSEAALSGGILGTFAIIMIVSLTWLIVAYNRHAHDVLRFLRHLVYVACAFVVVLLCTNSCSYLQSEVPNGSPPAVSILIYLVGGLLYLFAIPIGPRATRSLPMRLAGLSRPADQVSGVLAGNAHRDGPSPVDRCAWAALGYLTVAAIADAFVLSLSSAAWDLPRAPVAYTVAWSSLLLPLAILIAALRAMAPEQTASAAPRRSANSPEYQKGSELAADVDQELLHRRFESYIVDHYTGLHNTVISVVLAVAGLAAASLGGSHAQYGGSYPLLWMLWLASLLLCATIFAGVMSGNVVAPPLMPTITDLLIPLLLGVGEFVLFGVLAHQVTGLNKTSAVAEAWFISLAVVSACAAAAITRAMHFFGSATYAPDISGPIDDYRFRRMPLDRTRALLIAVMGIGGAVASAAQVAWLEYVLAASTIAGLLMALGGHARSAAVLRTAISPAGSTREVASPNESLTRANGEHSAT
jgi:hypothetical protein